MTKIKLFRVSLVLLLSIVTMGIIVGCASTNKAYNPNLSISESNQPYVANETGTKIVRYGNQAAPLVPQPYNTPLIAVLGLATATMGWLAKRKNDQAAAAQATTSQLAASVVAQGESTTQKVLDAASYNEKTYPAVADAINKKTVA